MKNTYLNKIRGCIVGGAAGDVLGYPVEPFHENQIRQIYGKDGIIAHQCPIGHNRAIVSDDTQMTMFTATGLIEAYKNPSPGKTVVGHVYDHYRDWLHTQEPSETGSGKSWLRNVPELNARRGPGYTCLKALKSGRCGTREEPLNPSKGCGGVMRVAPVALCIGRDEKFLSLEELEELDLTGADTAAITHGHPLGYIPAAALVHKNGYEILEWIEKNNLATPTGRISALGYTGLPLYSPATHLHGFCSIPVACKVSITKKNNKRKSIGCGFHNPIGAFRRKANYKHENH